MAVCREVDPEQEADGGGNLGKAVHEHVEARDRGGLFDLGSAKLIGLEGELFESRGAAAEGFEYADALHGLFDCGGEVAVLILREAREGGELPVEAEREDPDRDRRCDEHESEDPARADE